MTIDPPARPVSWGRRLLIAFGVLLALVLLLVLLAPTLLSTSPGRSFILSKVNGTIAGSVKAEGLSLGWSRGQSVTGVTLLDPEGKTVLTAKSVELPDLSLWSFVTGGRAVGLVRIADPVLTITQDERGMNLTRAVALREVKQDGVTEKKETDAAKPSEPLTLPAELALKIELANGLVTYSDVATTAELSGLTVKADLSAPAKIAASISSVTRVGSQAGKLDGSVTVSDAFDSSGVLQMSRGRVEADVDATGIPVALIDALAKQEGYLSGVLGSVASGKVTATGPLDKMDIDVALKSDHASLAGALSVGREAIASRAPLELTLRVTPESWAVVTRGQSREQAARLVEPFDVKLRVDRLNLPRRGDGSVSLGGAGVKLTGGIGRVVMDAPGGVGRLVLREAKVELTSESLAKAVSGGLKLVAEQGGQVGGADVTFDVRDLLDGSDAVNMKSLRVEVDGTVKELPLAVLDQLAATDGLLVDAIGPKLDATLNARLSPTEDGRSATGPFHVVAIGRNLNAKLAGRLTPTELALDDGGSATLTVAPALLAKLTGAAPGDKDAMRIDEPAVMQLRIGSLKLPVVDHAMDTKAAALSLAITTDRLLLAGMGIPGQAAVSKVVINITSERLDKGVIAELASVVAHPVGSTAPGSLNARAEITHLFDAQGGLAPDGARIAYTLDGKQLSSPLVDGILGQDGLLAILAGRATDARLSGNVTPTTAPAGREITSTLAVRTPSLTLDAKAKITPDLLTIEPGSDLTLKIDPAMFSSLTDHFAAEEAPATTATPATPSQPLGIASTSTLRVKISSLSAQRGEKADRGQTRIGLSGSIDQLELTGLPAKASLANTTFTLADGRLADTLHLNLASRLVTGGSDGTLKAVANIADAMTDKPKLDATLDATTLPVALLDALGEQGGRLVALLGPTLGDVKLAAQRSGTASSFTAAIQAERLKADVAGSFDPGRHVTLKEGSKVELTLTPEGYAAWAKPEKGEMSVALLGVSRVVLLVKQLDIGYSQAASADASPAIDPAQTKLGTTISIPTIAFVRPDKQIVRLRDVNASVQTSDLSKLLDLQLNAAIDNGKSTADAAGTGGTGGGGAIASSTQITGIRVTDGSPDFSKSGYTTSTTGTALPVDLIDALLNQEGGLTAIMGRSATVKINGTRAPGSDGTLDVDLDSDNARVSLLGSIDEKNVFKLRQDAVASLRVTPELGKAYLSTASPILSEVKSGEQPIRLTLSKQGFAIPLDDPRLATVGMEGNLEIGTLIVRRNEMAGRLTTALRALGSPIRDLPEFPARFTPLKFKIADGVLTSNDLWMDTGELFMGVQTRVTENLKTGLRSTEVLIAVPGETLNLIPKVAGKVKSDTILELVARSTGNEAPKPDYGAMLTTNLAPILAASSTKGETAAMVQGGLQALQGLRRDKKEPTEAPWADRNWTNRPKVHREAPVVQPEAAPGTPSESPSSQPAAAAPVTPAQPVEAKPAEAKPTEAKPAESKPADPLGDLLQRALREREEREQRKKEEEAKKKERRAQEKAEKEAAQ